VANFIGGTVSVIDTATNTIIATIPVGGVLAGIDITPNGAFAYVAQESGNTVSVIDTATNIVTTVVPVGSVPRGVAITPNGTSVYAVNPLSNTVSVIDTATTLKDFRKPDCRLALWLCIAALVREAI
jgi:YVTN family beta-propeller protein